MCALFTGKLSEEEFLSNIDLLDIDLDHPEACYITMDRDGDGTVDLREFSVWLAQIKFRKEKAALGDAERAYVQIIIFGFVFFGQCATWPLLKISRTFAWKVCIFSSSRAQSVPNLCGFRCRYASSTSHGTNAVLDVTFRDTLTARKIQPHYVAMLLDNDIDSFGALVLVYH